MFVGSVTVAVLETDCPAEIDPLNSELPNTVGSDPSALLENDISSIQGPLAVAVPVLVNE
jgi:hypothetical protein